MKTFEIKINTDFGIQSRRIVAHNMFDADRLAQEKYGSKHIETVAVPLY